MLHNTIRSRNNNFMNKATVSLMVMLALMLTACNFQASFLLINRSGDIAEVTYAFKNAVEFSCPEGELFKSLSVLDADEVGNKEAEWAPLGPGEFVCDLAARSVFVPVGPGVALKVVEHGDPGEEYSSIDRKYFPIDSLFINGPEGSMRFTGAQVLGAFEFSDTPFTYFIIYK